MKYDSLEYTYWPIQGALRNSAPGIVRFDILSEIWHLWSTGCFGAILTFKLRFVKRSDADLFCKSWHPDQEYSLVAKVRQSRVKIITHNLLLLLRQNAQLVLS